MRQINLAKGRGVALVDDEDYYDVVASGPWFLLPKGYAIRNVRRPDGKGTTQRLHQFLMGYRTGFTVDHINRNGLDCRRSNMRWATPTQQSANRGRASNNTSGYIGVSWHRGTEKWQAQIRVRGEKRHIGAYAEKERAARAYDEEALRLFGAFAETNFPEGDYAAEIGGLV